MPLDTVNPVIQILSPTAGLQVSNAQVTVSGTAGDNVAVAGVYYQINGGAWSEAGTGDAWTNWTADNVALAPGSNTVSAYAVDTSGHLSSTSRVSFVSIQFAALTVLANGKGTFTPPLNGQSLQIGKTYNLTAAAAPGSGFAFTNWSSNLNGVLTNRAALAFVMGSGLVLTANFADEVKPTLTVSAPKAGIHVTNATLVASGTATDNGVIASVLYQLNGGSWTAAVGGSNWTALLTLNPGTHVLSVCAWMAVRTTPPRTPSGSSTS